jgi:hypothetical protein
MLELQHRKAGAITANNYEMWRRDSAVMTRAANVSSDSREKQKQQLATSKMSGSSSLTI